VVKPVAVMKHIMIPTDFSIRSLNVVRYAAAHFESEQLKVTLLHFMEMPDSISDLLMLPRDNSHFKLITPEFREGMSLLRNCYPLGVEQIRTDFLIGKGRRLLKNYLEHQKIDSVLLAENYDMKIPSRRSYNPINLIRSTGWSIVNVELPLHAISVADTGMAGLLLATA
jgi:hypothetical protein